MALDLKALNKKIREFIESSNSSGLQASLDTQRLEKTVKIDSEIYILAFQKFLDSDAKEVTDSYKVLEALNTHLHDKKYHTLYIRDKSYAKIFSLFKVYEKVRDHKKLTEKDALAITGIKTKGEEGTEIPFIFDIEAYETKVKLVEERHKHRDVLTYLDTKVTNLNLVVLKKVKATTKVADILDSKKRAEKTRDTFKEGLSEFIEQTIKAIKADAKFKDANGKFAFTDIEIRNILIERIKITCPAALRISKYEIDKYLAAADIKTALEAVDHTKPKKIDKALKTLTERLEATPAYLIDISDLNFSFLVPEEGAEKATVDAMAKVNTGIGKLWAAQLTRLSKTIDYYKDKPGREEYLERSVLAYEALYEKLSKVQVVEDKTVENTVKVKAALKSLDPKKPGEVRETIAKIAAIFTNSPAYMVDTTDMTFAITAPEGADDATMKTVSDINASLAKFWITHLDRLAKDIDTLKGKAGKEEALERTITVYKKLHAQLSAIKPPVLDLTARTETVKAAMKIDPMADTAEIATALKTLADKLKATPVYMLDIDSIDITEVSVPDGVTEDELLDVELDVRRINTETTLLWTEQLQRLEASIKELKGKPGREEILERSVVAYQTLYEKLKTLDSFKYIIGLQPTPDIKKTSDSLGEGDPYANLETLKSQLAASPAFTIDLSEIDIEQYAPTESATPEQVSDIEDLNLKILDIWFEHLENLGDIIKYYENKPGREETLAKSIESYITLHQKLSEIDKFIDQIPDLKERHGSITELNTKFATVKKFIGKQLTSPTDPKTFAKDLKDAKDEIAKRSYPELLTAHKTPEGIDDVLTAAKTVTKERSYTTYLKGLASPDSFKAVLAKAQQAVNDRSFKSHTSTGVPKYRLTHFEERGIKLLSKATADKPLTKEEAKLLEQFMETAAQNPVLVTRLTRILATDRSFITDHKASIESVKTFAELTQNLNEMLALVVEVETALIKSDAAVSLEAVSTKLEDLEKITKLTKIIDKLKENGVIKDSKTLLQLQNYILRAQNAHTALSEKKLDFAIVTADLTDFNSTALKDVQDHNFNALNKLLDSKKLKLIKIEHNVYIKAFESFIACDPADLTNSFKILERLEEHYNDPRYHNIYATDPKYKDITALLSVYSKIKAGTKLEVKEISAIAKTGLDINALTKKTKLAQEKQQRRATLKFIDSRLDTDLALKIFYPKDGKFASVRKTLKRPPKRTDSEIKIDIGKYVPELYAKIFNDYKSSEQFKDASGKLLYTDTELKCLIYDRVKLTCLTHFGIQSYDMDSLIAATYKIDTGIEDIVLEATKSETVDKCLKGIEKLSQAFSKYPKASLFPYDNYTSYYFSTHEEYSLKYSKAITKLWGTQLEKIGEEIEYYKDKPGQKENLEKALKAYIHLHSRLQGFKRHWKTLRACDKKFGKASALKELLNETQVALDERSFKAYKAVVHPAKALMRYEERFFAAFKKANDYDNYEICKDILDKGEKLNSEWAKKYKLLKHTQPLTESETKLIADFYEMAIDNPALNKRLFKGVKKAQSKLLQVLYYAQDFADSPRLNKFIKWLERKDEFKQSPTTFATDNSSLIMQLAKFSFKTKGIDKTLKSLEKLEKLLDNIEHMRDYRPQDASEQMTLSEYGTIMKLQDLMDELETLKRLGVLEKSAKLSEIYNAGIRAKEAVAKVDKILVKDMKFHSGDIMVDISSKYSRLYKTRGGLFEKVKSYITGGRMHVSVAIQEKGKALPEISHIDAEYERFALEGMTALPVKTLRVNPMKLLENSTIDTLLDIELGGAKNRHDLQLFLESEFERITNGVHAKGSKYIDEESLENAQEQQAYAALASFGYKTTREGGDVKKWAKDMIEADAPELLREGDTGIICSGFAAKTLVISLALLEKAIKEAAPDGTKLPDDVVKMPFKRDINLSKIDPGRLVKLLERSGCVDEIKVASAGIEQIFVH